MPAPASRKPLPCIPVLALHIGLGVAALGLQSTRQAMPEPILTNIPELETVHAVAPVDGERRARDLGRPAQQDKKNMANQDIFAWQRPASPKESHCQVSYDRCIDTFTSGCCGWGRHYRQTIHHDRLRRRDHRDHGHLPSGRHRHRHHRSGTSLEDEGQSAASLP